ncbi:MAG: hypothetical protein E6I41_06365 [Chloroflexi bacterium]|nr:MAG: hypothetical protein E6I41_06365 [Chloroflexota bacterium]
MRTFGTNEVPPTRAMRSAGPSVRYRAIFIRNTGRAVMTPSLGQARWDVIPPGPHPAHMHMALDEVLLQQVMSGQRPPTMRLWRWIERALVIGSHQSVVNEVDLEAAEELGFVITRRMSGGGTMLCEPERTITYSMYLPDSMVAGISFRKSYALLDGWAVRAFNELGVPASYREINDIISPRGKIGGAAQARRRGFVLSAAMRSPGNSTPISHGSSTRATLRCRELSWKWRDASSSRSTRQSIGSTVCLRG